MNRGYGSFADCYDRLNRDFPYAQVADRYDAIIKRFGAPGDILLDIGCGTGTLSFLMEQKGYDVVGIDLSDAMLSHAFQKKMESASNALFLRQDMTRLDMFGTMDVTISCLDCINHLPDFAAVQKTFERVHLFGAPDSLFIFDCNTVYKHQHVLGGQTFVYDMEDVYCVWQNALQEQNTVQIDLDLFLEDEEEKGVFFRMSESFCERAYEQKQIEDLLQQTGFLLLGVYDGFSENAPHEKSERLLFAARVIKDI